MRRLSRFVVELVGAVKRWEYDDGHPAGLMRVMNRIDARLYASGVLAPRHAATLEVIGRRSGRPVSLPVAIVDYDGDRYLVSMLGEDVNWVRNVRAAGGDAVLRHRGRKPVMLEEVPVDGRAPILRRYLAVAPGARPHIPADRRAPLSEFEPIADRYPVFLIRSRRHVRPRGRDG